MIARVPDGVDRTPVDTVRSYDAVTLIVEGVLIVVVVATLIGAFVTALPLVGLLSAVGITAAIVAVLGLIGAAALLGRARADDAEVARLDIAEARHLEDF